MTNEQLKDLEDKLWDSANALRAYGGLKASDYADRRFDLMLGSNFFII